MEFPTIALLRDEVIDQIAAGEVVERPASVVKELVENALDAGARRVHVDSADGGKRLIRVVDDGHGMTPEQLRLCVQRHATSKLRQVEDLDTISTMGFRGEALPSIASVSRLTITSRARGSGDGHGSRLLIEGGKVGEVEPAACAPGTTLEVADLFFNTPARLKFLKSTATEAAHIGDTINHAALGAPGVHFTLKGETRRGIDLPPCQGRLERCKAALGRWGRELRASDLLDRGSGRAQAILAPPSQTMRTSRHLTLMVNGRQVRDRALLQAVLSGYGHLLDRGRYPVGVIYLDLPPETLDVNVHPQKTEVRFAEPRKVFSLARRCVEELMAVSPWLSERETAAPPPARTYALPSQPRQGSGYGEHKARLMEATRRFWSRRPDARSALEQSEESYRPGPAEDSESSGYFGSLNVIGQAMGLFIVCEGEDEIVLIDQHAAHERVTFERLRGAAASGDIPSQRLLIPARVELDPLQLAAAGENTEQLRQLGTELDPFDGECLVRAVPAVLAAADPGPMVRDLLDELRGQGEGLSVEEAREAVLSRMACHGSVRQGKGLDPAEILALLSSLDQVDFSAACPHGRPVLIQLSRQELEQRIKRQ